MSVLLRLIMSDHPGKQINQLFFMRVISSLCESNLVLPFLFPDEQRLTKSALLYSGQLSPIDQHLVKQFNKGNLPSVTCILNVLKTVVQLSQ